MKKRIICFILSLLFVTASLAVPVAASGADAPTDTPSEFDVIKTALSDIFSSFTSSITGSIDNVASTVGDLFDKVKSLGDDITNIGDLVSALLQLPKTLWDDITTPFAHELAMYEIRDGGYNYVSNALNTEIGKLYQITYPIGVVIMLVCWVFGIFKNGISSQFDLSDKHSIVRACLSIIISLVVMSMTSYILTVLTSVSRDLCNQIADSMTIGNITPSPPITSAGPTTGIQILNYVPAFNAIAYGIFSFVIRFILKLNILYIALLQGIAPIFIGFSGGEGTRKLTINFCKAYAKAMLIPPVTIAYTVFATQLMVGSPWDLIGAIVLAISCIGIGKKALNELFA